MDIESDEERFTVQINGEVVQLLPLHKDENESESEGRLESQTPQYTIDQAISKIGLGPFQLHVFNFGGLIWLLGAPLALHNALLSHAWQCEFQLSNTEVAIITVMSSVGNWVASAPIGLMCDKFGRKKIITIAHVFMIYFAILSALAPNFFWLVVLRFFIGVLAVAANHAATYSVEFMPIRVRSAAVMLLNIYWTVGLLLLVLLSYLIVPVLGWRVLVFVSSIILIIIPLYYPIIPTSPRFLMGRGRVQDANKVLKLGAKINCRSLPNGQLVQDSDSAETNQVQMELLSQLETADIATETDIPQVRMRNLTSKLKRICNKKGVLEIISKKYLLTTIILAVIWFTSAFIYYGVVLITSDIFTYDQHCTHVIYSNTTNNTVIETVNPNEFCNPLTNEDYYEYLITTLAEVPGTVITILILEIIGRKLTFFSEFLISGGSFFVLFLCTSFDRALKTAALFLIRGCISAIFMVTYLYTTEVYPTHIRATALSIHSSFARVAVILSTFVAQVLLRSNFLVAVCLFGGLGIFTAIISLILPYETKGKKLK